MSRISLTLIGAPAIIVFALTGCIFGSPDSDDDGLSNKEEEELGLDPWVGSGWWKNLNHLWFLWFLLWLVAGSYLAAQVTVGGKTEDWADYVQFKSAADNAKWKGKLIPMAV